ncbi:autoinducer 2 ABC transporter substrate-binding protein [Paenibacillus chibensis]|uniref:autoinducer 2 ABC transporter substrate-binding protein n=1 Tax=Paenibacillus chibensis TaxID=59846 RepID=UPI000FD9468B|nr:autoinducer 2 ABC transporter substrate-binding protein [Paenibacillus chibensis]MEC0369139.1 autoinducer 2 ABC transporter substrate-binding protein [Paenibacillus chibensis]
MWTEGVIDLLRLLCSLCMIVIFVSACQPAGNPKFEVVYSMEPSSGTDAAEPPVKSSDHPWTIGIVPKLVEIPYFNLVEQGALEAAESLGAQVIYKGPPIADTTQQIRIIQDFIQEHVDAIAVSAIDPEKLLPTLVQARQAGIKVITWDSDTYREGRDFFVNMVDNEKLGRHLMDTLAWNTGEKGKFAILTGQMKAATLNEWIKWMKVQQKTYYPDMELVEIAATDDDPGKAYEEAKRLLADHPHLAGIIGNSSVGPPAAAQAVKEAGLTGKVKVVGLSMPNSMAPYLQDGSAQVATLWSPKKLGYLTVVLAVQALKGNPPQDGMNVPNFGIVRVAGDVVVMGDPVDFTKENVNQYDF